MLRLMTNAANFPIINYDLVVCVNFPYIIVIKSTIIPETPIIFFLIGIIAGIILYLDGWRLSNDSKELSESPRYRGFVIVFTGGVISGLIDNLVVLGTEKYDCFRGYLFGVVVGWLTLFISVTLLYVFWKNTKDLSPNTKFYRLGQISYSFIEVVSGGISVDPIQRQKDLENQLYENKILEIKQRLKQENPQAYVAFEEQHLQSQQYELKTQQENLENLKSAIARADSEPEQEAEKLIQDKNQLIETLQNELELARSRQSSAQARKIEAVIKEVHCDRRLL